VTADAEVRAAQGLATTGAGGELSPGPLGERRVGRSDQLLALPRGLQPQFSLGKPRARRFQLACAGGELSLEPLAGPLVLARLTRADGTR